MAFNSEVARRVTDLVSKDGEVLARMLVNDLYSWDLKANERQLRAIQKSYDAHVTEEVAKSCLELIEKGHESEAVALAASVAIAKDGDAWKYQERDASGRWGRMTRSEYKAKVKAVRASTKVSQKEKERELKTLRRQRGGAVYENADRLGRTGVKAARSFEQDWNRAPSGHSGATDNFHRLEAGGKLVQQLGVDTGKPGLALAGAVGNYAGQFGPEAEKIVGPSLRRAAYRYRGTERTPDKDLDKLGEMQARQLLHAEGRELGAHTQRVRLKDGQVKTVAVPNTSALKTLSPEERQYAMEQATVQYFMGDKRQGRPSRIPKASRAELHRKSGRITPSEGVIIDAQGNVAHQAIGFGEDHYLPFNLKNLGALKGGSYIRTRESGGLTTEDIYTGLMSGARSMTVVSNSGVFTVDFDDTLRGGRRFNDKALQMVDRYAKTLDAVKSKQVANPERQMKPMEKARLRAAIEEKINGDPDLKYYPQERRDQWVNEEFNRELQRPHLSTEKLKAMQKEAKEGTDNPREQEYIYRQLVDQALEEQATANYQLDGDGYAAAMEAMREQFPYYIDQVRYQTRTGAQGDYSGVFNTSLDYGYVKPKFVRPEGALEGYYDSSITGSEKTTADRTGYQNWRVRQGQREVTPSSLGGAEVKQESEPEQIKAAARNKEAQSAERAKYASYVGQDAAAWEALHNDAPAASKLSPKYTALHEFFDADEEGRKAILNDPKRVTALERDLDQVDKDINIEGGGKPSYRKDYASVAARGKLSDESVQEDYSPVSPLQVSDDDVNEMTANPKMAAEMRQLTDRDDSELKRLSDQFRTQRANYRESNPEMAKQATYAIRQIEVARGMKTRRPEMDADEYQAKLAGVLKPLQSANASTVTAPVNDALAQIGRRWERGFYENATQVRSDARKAVEDLASHLPTHVREGMLKDFLESLSDKSNN